MRFIRMPYESSITTLVVYMRHEAMFTGRHDREALTYLLKIEYQCRSGTLPFGPSVKVSVILVSA